MNKDQIKALQIEMIRRGNLDFLRKPDQLKVKAKIKEFFDQPLEDRKGRCFAVDAYRGFGKTFEAVLDIIEAGLKDSVGHIKNCQNFYAAAEYSAIKKFIHPTFSQILSLGPFEEAGVKILRKNDNSYHISNPFTGSEMIIYIVGIDQTPDAGRGNTVWLYVYDECGFIRNYKDHYHSVVLPATGREEIIDVSRVLRFTTPPTSPDHYTKEQMIDLKKMGAYMKLPLSESSLPQRIKDQYRLDCKSDTTFDREYECEYVTDASKAIIPNFSKFIDKIVVKDYTEAQWANYHTAGDHGFKDNTGIVCGYWDVYKSKAVITGCAKLHKPKSREIADKIMEMETRYFPPMTDLDYRPFDAAPQTIADISDAGVWVQKMPLKEKMAELVHHCIDMMDNEELVILDNEENQSLIQELDFGQWEDENRRKFLRTEQLGHCDVAAALMYFLKSLNRYTNPKPTNYGVDKGDHIVFDQHHGNEADVGKVIQELGDLPDWEDDDF